MNNVISDERKAYIAGLSKIEIVKKDESALRFLLNNPNGRWFLMRLLDNTNALSESYTGESASTIYNEGKRAVGLTYIKELAKLGIKGIELKQKAEMEYAKFMVKAQQLANRLADDKGGDYDG